MFVQFFTDLKAAGVPVTLREYLTLMEAMEHDPAGRRVEDFYYLSRSALVKDERNLDKFDRVFGHVFKGLDLIEQALSADIPEEWLGKIPQKYLTQRKKKQNSARSGTTRSKCWRCSTSAARWTGTSSWWRNCSRPRAPSSSTSRTSTSTIA